MANIRLVEGNIFSSNASCIVNATNSVGVMGAGLAKAFYQKYPDVCKEFNKRSQMKQGWNCSNPILLSPTLYTPEDTKSDKYILMFPTKKHWREPSKLEYINLGLVLAFDLLEAAKVPSAAFPLLGCGLGGLKREEVIDSFHKKSYIYSGRVDIHIR